MICMCSHTRKQHDGNGRCTDVFCSCDTWRDKDTTEKFIRMITATVGELHPDDRVKLLEALTSTYPDMTIH